VGGGWRQNSGSSSSPNCSSEEESTGTFSGRTVGVHTEWRQLLYALVILSWATKTRSYPESSSDRKFLHRRLIKTGCEYFAPRVCCELEIKCCRRNVFKQTVCYLVIRLWIICNTGLLKDICSRPKMLRWTQRPTQ